MYVMSLHKILQEFPSSSQTEKNARFNSQLLHQEFYILASKTDISPLIFITSLQILTILQCLLK